MHEEYDALIVRRLRWAAIASVLLIWSLRPVSASCADSRVFSSVSSEPGQTSYVYTPGTFGFLGFCFREPTRDCVRDGDCAHGDSCDVPASSVSSSFVGTFWSLGTGDPAIGAGNDSGTFSALDGWLSQTPGFPAAIQGSWNQDSGIDGCIDSDSESSQCMAVLLTDTSVVTGLPMFALLTEPSDEAGNYDFRRVDGAPINLAEMPPATVEDRNVWQAPNEDLFIEVTSPAIPVSGRFEDPSCGNSSVVGYKIWVNIKLRGGIPPGFDILDDQWTLAHLADGSPQAVNAFGDFVQLHFPCGSLPDSDLYLGTQLIFDSGFATPTVAVNDQACPSADYRVKFECGPNRYGLECDQLWDADGDGALFFDCDDFDPTVFPGAPELCDGRDNDCDGNIPTNELGDFDDDGFVNCVDNCPGSHNPDQIDVDADGAGDDCDCDSLSPDIFPGAWEINDAADNQCPGEPGNGIIDETSGVSGFLGTAQLRERYSWVPQRFATMYEVARSTSPDFSDSCSVVHMSDSWDDFEQPLPGVVFHYLNRAVAPNCGSWGQGSEGLERQVLCPQASKCGDVQAAGPGLVSSSSVRK